MPELARCVLFCTLLLVGLCVSGQPTTWDWAVGNNNGNYEQVRDIAVDTVNNAVYSTGTYDDAGPFGLGVPSGGTDGFLAKTDLNGNVIWAVKIGGAFNDGCQGVAVGSDGNIYITGSFNTAMTVNLLGNLLLLSSGQSDLFVACYAPTGSLQWVKTGGGTGDDVGYAIAVNSTGVFVQGTYKGGAAFGASTTPAGLSNGHIQAVLLKYSLTGNLLWRIDGTSTNKDQNAERIACDEFGVYLTGTFGTNQMRWYNGGTLLTTINATGDPNIYVCAVNNDGTMNWAQAVSNPGDATINGNAIAVGCSMVYIAGSVHNGAIFPGGTVISATGSPHDYLYLAALNKSTGGTRWVRTMRDADDHMGVAYDLAVHANGNIFMCGSYEDNATFSDGTTIQTTGGGGYALDAFVARYTPYGQLSWATTANGSDDDVPLAIAVNRTSGIYTGGFFNDDLTFPPIAINSNANASLFLARLSDAPNAYWSQNPSGWSPPISVCANAGALDLNVSVPAFNREYADLVTASTGVSDPNNIVGAPNGSVVLFSTDGSTLTADLTTTIPPSNTFTIVWGKQAAFAGTASFQLETSPDNATWTTLTAPTITAVSTTLVNSVVQATAPTRYVRITKNNLLSAVNFKVDALKFFHGSLQGGTWSGPGVTSAGIFDPSAFAGQSVAITYTVSNGTCPSSSTNSITIEPEPIGGSVTSSVIGAQCPGNNAGTLTLMGYVGTILEWQVSADNFASFTVLGNTLATYSFSNLTQATSYRARVSNNCGTVLSASYTVQVGDNAAPVITCPLPRTIHVGANCKAPIPDLLPSAVGVDNCSTTLTWTQSPAAFSLVNMGIHVVVVTATDGVGNATTCNVTITALDTTPPVISGCPASFTMNADPGECSAVYDFNAPTATDDCGIVLNAINVISIVDVDGLAVSVLNAPNEYPVGVTTRTFTFVDASGNSSVCSFDITVIDDQWPTVASCPGDITVPASPGLCGSAVNYAIPVFADNCSYRVERTQGAASGDVFPVGTTPVEHLATDSAGNSVICTFNVNVQDSEAPVLTGCPSNFIVQAPLAGTGANATWTPPIASDNCGAATITQTFGLSPGSFLTIGAHVITYTATAPNGVISTCTFTITVISNDAPSITCPVNQVLYSTPFACAQVFSYPTPPVGDDLAVPPGQPVQIDGTGHTSGSTFPLGSTVQTWRVTDSNSNSTTCSFAVQVIDTIRPSFPSCPTTVTISAEPGVCGAHFTYAVQAPTDNCPGAISVVRLLGPASGSLFPIGSTLVRHQAMDASGNTVLCQFNVTVVDDILPTLSNCSTDISVTAAPNLCGAHVTFTPPTAQDNCLVTLTRTAGPASGTLFPIGDTWVEFTATDPEGNSVTCGFNVHVDDLTAPLFTYCPDTLTVASDPGQCGAVVNYASPIAEDNCIATLTPPTGQLSGAFFPVGSNAVSYTVTDGISNATCTFQIVVIDNEAPAILGLPADISVSTDPSDSMALVTWASPNVSDNCVASITADHASGDAFGIGTTPVTYTAVDAMHSISATFLVTVTDDEDPVITCPSNDTLEVDATCSAAMPSYTATASDNHIIDSIWQTEGPVSNDPLTLVSAPYYTKWAAMDSSGNITTCVQWIELIDVDAPVITCLWPAPIELNADQNCAAIVPSLSSQQTYDDCSGVTVDQDPEPGTVIYGDTVITTTVTDSFGNVNTTTDQVHLVDITPPQHDALPDTMELGIEYWMPLCHAHIPDLYPLLNSVDGCSGIDHVDQTPPPNTDFVVAPQWVFVEIADNAGNIARDSVWVIPVDAEAPLLDCSLAGPVEVPGDGSCNAVVPNVLGAIGVDECYLVDLYQTPAVGSPISADVTVVVTAVDSAGNISTCSVDVFITDTMAPVFNCALSMTVNSEPGACGATVSLPSGAAVDTLINDNCDPSPTWSQIAGPPSGFFPVDTTWIIYEAKDAIGNTTTCTFSVIVIGETVPALDYGGTQFCSTGGPLSPIVAMPVGGSFECSTCAGGIDSDGTIDLSAIGVGTHAISYTNACTAPDSTSTTITVTAPASATINYPTAPFCSTEGTAVVDVSGPTGGTFSSPTGLVFIDQATGEVDPGSSPSATHTVIYALPASGGCPAFTTSTTVQVVAVSWSMIDYTDSIYCNISAVVPVVNTTATPGNYTHTPIGLALDSTTGSISLGTASQPGNYDITFTLPANAACPAFSATDRVVITAPSNAGGDTAIALCTTSPALNLFSSLGPSAQAGGQWFKPFMGYMPFGGSVVPSAYPAGGTYSYAYVVTGTPPCANDTALVTVTYNVAANAGTNDTLITCNSGAAQSLFAQLGGTPMVGGVWAGPSPVAGGMYDPAIHAPGSYLYTVTGAPPCTNSSATVIVSETLAPTAGTNGLMTVCSTDLPQSLTSRLGGIPASGGIWSGPSPVVGVIYDPANMDPGVYTYEVNGPAPCPNATATVTVTENTASNWYADGDGDGTGDALDVVLACSQPPGFVGNGTDPCPSVAFAVPGSSCNDNNAATGNDIYQADCTCAGQLIDCPGVPGGTAIVGTACDDGNANTGNDLYDANCVCAGQLIDCLGVPGGTALIGTACNDGNANTGNDVYGANCVCAGQLIDCLGVPGGASLPSTSCDDGNANTGNDVYGANCVCAGELIDCLGVPGGTAIVGTACDDGNANTGNDVYGANCVCAGELVDCLGVPGGPAQPGTPCNDNNQNTGNDVYQSNCTCAGQLIDCEGVPGGAALPGTSCDDGNALTGDDIYGPNCVCHGQVIDCLGVVGGADLPGAPCNDGLNTTGNDVWSAACLCQGQPIDCLGVPGGTAIVGTACDDGNANTGYDLYGASCVCAGQLIDCLGVPGGTAIVGTACDDGNANTGNDLYGASCVCAGQLIDCLGVPGGTAIVGTACDDGNANTGNDLYDANCVCAGQLIDCLGVPGGTAIVGTACDDGNANTGNDLYGASCVCAGQLIDCLGVPGGTAIVGTACDDGNANTGNDLYDANCVCAGEQIDCLGVPGGTAIVGTACDDGNPNSSSDVYGANCVCAGTFANDCLGVPGGPAQPGTPCDDGLTNTGNDLYDATCVCAGQLIDCLGVPGGAALPGTICDDGNALTGDDIYGPNCVCLGQVIDCLGVVGGADLPGAPCNDGLNTTGNDVWSAACLCQGQPIDCLGVPGGTAIVGTACDDGNANTGNDLYDANCVCAGQLIDCLGVPGGTAIVGTACDDGNPNSSSDVYGANCVCAGTFANDCLGVPGGPAQPGTPCDDGLTNTGNDLYDATCVCAGQLIDCLGVPGGAALPGTICDDGDPDTGNDMWNVNCICAGQLIDCIGVPNGITLPGTGCDDGNACTSGDFYDTNCACVGTPITCNDGDPCTIDSCDPVLGCQFTPAPDSDGDGICDAIDNCPTVLGQIGSPCDDNSACSTGDILDANCNCLGTPITCDDGDPCTIDSCDPVIGCQFTPATDSDGDGICDAIDNCPTVFGQFGSPCDDNNACTTGDMLDANCICAGSPITHDAAFAYSNIAYCTNSSDPIPWIAELGGVFSADPSGLAIDILTGEIDLDMSTPNSYHVSYAVGGACPNSSTQQVDISEPPNASWIHPGPICITQGPQDLNLLVTGDDGGVWQGDGMTGSIFDPTIGLGTYELTYTVILGACTASVSQTVLVNPGPYADAGPDTTVCGLVAQVHAVLLQAGGFWSGPASLAISNPSDPSAWVTASIPGTYTLLWTVGTAPCIATDSVHITFHDPNEPLWVSAGDDQYLAVFTATQLHGQGSEGATILWTVITGTGSPTDPSDAASDITGLSIGENTLVLTASIGGCGFASDTVTITVQDLFIPQGFSPNGDGVNDRFEITGIEAYPGNDLKVFDRWGRPVMAQKDYDNSWDGRTRNGVPLLDDTYFYVLNLSEGLTYNGYLIIKR